MISYRQTWFWLCLAGGLFAFIFFYQRHTHKPPAGPPRVLPQLDPAAVASVQVRPSGPIPLQIRADKTNDMWRLVEPLDYPAQSKSVEGLIDQLAKLTAATCITPAEMRARPRADEEYGFSSPQASLIIQQGDYRAHVLIGARTAPGDQVFLQVVGIEGAYVVDADWLKLLPRSANDWRDTTLVDLRALAFDQVSVTNNSKVFVLQRAGTNGQWRITWPFTEGARADNSRIQVCLEKLQLLRIRRFVSDEPRTDLDTLGLAPAELAITLARGSNALVSLQFGKSPTNDATQVFARRAGEPTLFTVSREQLDLWRRPINEFRDPYLIGLTGLPESIEVSAAGQFSVNRQTNGTWLVSPDGFNADPDLVRELLSTLSNLQIVQFVKDVVNPPDLPEFGLATPARQYVLRFAPGPAAGPVTNTVQFGTSTNQPGRVFARRPDESSVYAVNTNDYALLPNDAWELRDRRLWHFSETNVARVTVREQGKQRQMLRNGPHQWSLAPGSQGIINDLAVEETVRGLLRVSASVWAARGAEQRARFGFKEGGRQIIIDLKDGESFTIEFGGEAPSTFPYAATMLDGELWIFEFPWPLYRDVVSYLSVS